MRKNEQNILVGANNFLRLPEETQKALKKKFPRQEVEQTQEVDNMSIPELLKRAEKFAKSWDKTVEDVSVHHYTEQDPYSDYGWSRLDITVSAPETESQYFDRLWTEHDTAQRRQEWERKEFERLSAKFSK